MRKATKMGLVLGVLLMFLALALVQTVSACEPPPPPPPPPPRQKTELIAGQHYDAGWVYAWVEDSTLHIKYDPADGWPITDTHLWVGNDWADMPQNKKGNPKIGHFPYSGELEYEVPMIEPNEDGIIYIVAHAVTNGETAWANTGNQIPSASCWALYFPFKVA
jgi:hypothetical protein